NSTSSNSSHKTNGPTSHTDSSSTADKSAAHANPNAIPAHSPRYARKSACNGAPTSPSASRWTNTARENPDLSRNPTADDCQPQNELHSQIAIKLKYVQMRLKSNGTLVNNPQRQTPLFTTYFILLKLRKSCV